MNTSTATTAAQPTIRLASLALAAVLTLAMLAGVNTLAVGDGAAAAQLAQAAAPRA